MALVIYAKTQKCTPMLNKYPEIAPGQESKVGPSNEALAAILNYSKSVEVKKLKSEKKILLNLN